MEKTDVKQKYHIEPPWGLLNDPVGLVWFNGEYHVFHEWNSKAKDHTYKEWSHLSSPDLLHWTRYQSPLVPDTVFDRNSVYSGSCIIKDGCLHAYYTGNRKDNGKRHVCQCLAMSRDGVHFFKAGPVLETPSAFTMHFRDPRVLHEDGKLAMYIGAQTLDLHGNIVRFTSEDGKRWSTGEIVGSSKNASMIECPDVLHRGDYDILIYCLQNRDPLTDECLESICVYKILPAGWTTTDLDDGWKYLDDGFDCFAAQSLLAPDGRHLLMAWMNRLGDEQEQMLASRSSSIHCLTLPREMDAEDGKLLQKPARELAEAFETVPLSIDTDQMLNTRTWHMDVVSDSSKDFEMIFNEREALIRWLPDEQRFELQRLDWVTGKMETRSICIERLDHLEIFMDTSSIEIFINHGEHVFSARILPQSAHSRIQVTGRDNLKSADLFRLRDAYKLIHTDAISESVMNHNTAHHTAALPSQPHEYA